MSEETRNMLSVEQWIEASEAVKKVDREILELCKGYDDFGQLVRPLLPFEMTLSNLRRLAKALNLSFNGSRNVKRELRIRVDALEERIEKLEGLKRELGIRIDRLEERLTHHWKD